MLSERPPGQRFSQTQRQEPMARQRGSCRPNTGPPGNVRHPVLAYSAYYSHQSIQCDMTLVAFEDISFQAKAVFA